MFDVFDGLDVVVGEMEDLDFLVTFDLCGHTTDSVVGHREFLQQCEGFEIFDGCYLVEVEFEYAKLG